MDPVVTDANTGGSFGRYHYANNNPYRFTDPTGMEPYDKCWWTAGCSDLNAASVVRATTSTVDNVITGGWGQKSDVSFQNGQYIQGMLQVGLGAGYGFVFIATAVEAGAVMIAGRVLVAKDLALEAGEVAVKGISNVVPSTMARVIPNGTPATTLGRPGAGDMFVTAASDIAGMSSKQIAQRLTIAESPTGFKVIEFATPRTGVASPVLRGDPGFVGGGRTAGGAREFVIPNGPIPGNAIIRTVP